MRLAALIKELIALNFSIGIQECLLVIYSENFSPYILATNKFTLLGKFSANSKPDVCSEPYTQSNSEIIDNSANIVHILPKKL